MILQWYDEIVTGDKVIKLKITEEELMKASLDKFDRLLLADCEKKGSTISDRILGLVTLCRKIEES